jgi:hypothetical protein
VHRADWVARTHYQLKFKQRAVEADAGDAQHDCPVLKIAGHTYGRQCQHLHSDTVIDDTTKFDNEI